MNRIKDLFLRYLIIILIALPNLFIFYLIFSPLTIYPLFVLFKIFFNDVLLIENIFYLSNNLSIEIIDACIAGSAYYLLFILNFSISDISIKKRFQMILFSFVFLLGLNIARIFILTSILTFPVQTTQLFDLTHKLFWYFGTTIFVVLIWFIQVKEFKIKSIPIYSDLKFLIKYLHNSKTSKKN